MEFVSFCVEYFFCAGTCKYCNTLRLARQALLTKKLWVIFSLLPKARKRPDHGMEHKYYGGDFWHEKIGPKSFPIMRSDEN
jgi:hypothetical protein